MMSRDLNQELNIHMSLYKFQDKLSIIKTSQGWLLFYEKNNLAPAFFCKLVKVEVCVISVEISSLSVYHIVSY